MTSLLTVRNLHITTDDPACELVHGISFDVQAGQSVGLVGESGSGKTLTLRAIAGLPPDGIHIRKPSSVALAEGTRTAMIFQNPRASLDPLQRVGRQLAEVERANHSIGRREARAAAMALLDRMDLPADACNRYPGQLSGGQCQRVGIARALAVEPDLLLCDEPTTALDVTVQAQILAMLADIRHRLGLGLIFVTHNLGVAAQVCDRLLVMRHGSIVEQGRTEEVLHHPRHSYTRELVRAVLPLPRPQAAHVENGVSGEGTSA